MKKWLMRALRTFGQSFVGYVTIAIPTIDWSADRSIIKATLLGIFASAVAGGISAIMNRKEQ